MSKQNAQMLKKRIEQEELAKVREQEQPSQLWEKRGRGRPSEYTEEEALDICVWIAEGRSLRSYCRARGREMHTIYRWLDSRSDFRQRYARAHEDRADSLADEITDIADEVATGTMEEIQAARLRVDTRKWVAAKMRPIKYGEAPPPVQKSAVVFNIGLPNRTATTVVDIPHTEAPTIASDAAPILGQ